MNRFFYLLLVLVLGFLMSSCNKDDDSILEQKSALTSSYDSYLNLDWIKVYLEVERDLSGFRPSATARALGYIHMAAYQTAFPGMNNRKSLSEIIPSADLPKFDDFENEYHWPTAVNAAYKTTFDHFIINTNSSQKGLINENYEKWNTHFEKQIDPEVKARSIAWGIKVSNALIAFAKTDVDAEEQIVNPRPNDYNPPVGLGLWVPTDGLALFPYWGNVRTYGTFNFDELLKDPLPVSISPNSDFYNQALEVNNVVENLGQKDRWVAEFWSDDIVGLTFSPPARMFAIVEQLIHQEEMNMESALLVSVKLGMSLNDASVICWYAKYKYNVIRPENFIREYINPDFKTILGESIGTSDISPPFPAYPSGHSTFASAGSGIFLSEFGEGYLFTDSCHANRKEFIGTPRSYISWQTMAEENAYSRIPLGVHFRMDCDEGLRLGYIVANNINKLFSN